MTNGEKATLALDDAIKHNYIYTNSSIYVLYYKGTRINIGNREFYNKPGPIKASLLKYLTTSRACILDPDDASHFMVPFSNKREAKDYIYELLVTGVLEIR